MSDENPVMPWSAEHPLCRNGIFPELGFTSEGEVKVAGLYNPVIDTIVLLEPTKDVFSHEVTHRVSSVHTGGFNALRGIASNSHSILLYLLGVIDAQEIRLSGGKLANLCSLDANSTGNLVNRLLERVRVLERLFDQCYFSLIPPMEMLAADFAPIDLGDGHALGLMWYLEHIEDTDENRRKKDKHVNYIAQALATSDKVFYSVLYTNVEAAVLDTWKVYTSIEDIAFRRTLLELAASVCLLHSDETGEDIKIADPLHVIRNEAQISHQPGAHKQLTELSGYAIESMWRNLAKTTKNTMKDIYDSEAPIVVANLLNHILCRSVPHPQNPFHATLRKTWELSPLFFAQISLLLFWNERDGQRHVLANPATARMVELTTKDDPTYQGSFMGPVVKDWRRNWDCVVGLEVLRQALKAGQPVECPFQGRKGRTFQSHCEIALLLTIIQKRTDIPVREVCSGCRS